MKQKGLKKWRCTYCCTEYLIQVLDSNWYEDLDDVPLLHCPCCGVDDLKGEVNGN